MFVFLIFNFSERRYIEVSLDDPNERDAKESENKARLITLHAKPPRKFPAADLADDTLIDVRFLCILLSSKIL